MNISNINNHSTIQAHTDKPDPKLREACNQFEGLLLGMILRDSISPSPNADTEVPGNGVMMDFASEQLAQNLSSNGGIGIADQLYKQIHNGGK